MESSTGFFAVWSPRALSVLRIVAAALFIQHGTAKLFHLPHVPSFDNLQLMSLVGGAGMLELGGGLLLLIGLFTRPVAFVLSGEMAFAYFIAHAPQGSAASSQRRRACGGVLLPVPVSVRRGRRSMEHRRVSATRGDILSLAEMLTMTGCRAEFIWPRWWKKQPVRMNSHLRASCATP